MKETGRKGLDGERFEARIFESSPGVLPYRLLKPDSYDRAKRYPLVLFLHGAGERGDDNRKQLAHGLEGFAGDDVMGRYPSFVVAPQCPDGVQWVDIDWSADSHTMPVAETPAGSRDPVY